MNRLGLGSSLNKFAEQAKQAGGRLAEQAKQAGNSLPTFDQLNTYQTKGGRRSGATSAGTQCMHQQTHATDSSVPMELGPRSITC